MKGELETVRGVEKIQSAKNSALGRCVFVPLSFVANQVTHCVAFNAPFRFL